MNIKNLVEHTFPFKHWEISDCLDQDTINEISLAKIPEGGRVYDGTRAADHTGEGIDGKLRLFVSKENSVYFPKITNLIKVLQKKETYTNIANLIEKDLSNSYVRLEIISDKKGFWLKPHKDIPEKLMTMMIWINKYDESDLLGTDLYNDNYDLVKTIKYINNHGYFFSSGNDTWHGLEMKEIKKERRCIQINYVTFETEWKVE